jgi:hypothetical protein
MGVLLSFSTLRKQPAHWIRRGHPKSAPSGQAEPTGARRKRTLDCMCEIRLVPELYELFNSQMNSSGDVPGVAWPPLLGERSRSFQPQSRVRVGRDHLGQLPRAVTDSGRFVLSHEEISRRTPRAAISRRQFDDTDRPLQPHELSPVNQAAAVRRQFRVNLDCRLGNTNIHCFVSMNAGSRRTPSFISDRAETLS